MILAIAIVAVLLGVVFGIPYVAGSTEKSAGHGSSGAGALGVLQEIFQPSGRDAEIVKMQIKDQKAAAPIGEGDDPQAQ